MKIRGTWCAVAMAVLLSSPVLAQETSSTTSSDPMRSPGGLYDATPHTRKSMLTVWGSLGWWSGLGVGARYTLPLVADGFLAELNDSVELEFGADLYFLGWYGYSSLDIPVEGRWSFHVLPNLSLYGKLAAGVQVDFLAGSLRLWPLFHFAPGAIYHLSENFAVRAELGYRGLRLGVAFAF